MPARLRKADPDAPLLGPPRNAMLWLRAKQMAEALGRPGDFQTILQTYQMLTLAPGFAAVSKGIAFEQNGAKDALSGPERPTTRCLDKARRPVLALGKANMGRKMKNGRREGAFKWVHREAKRRGKPKAYAVALARKIMGKSVAHLIAGQRLNESGMWDHVVAQAAQPSPAYDLRPTRQVAALGDVLRGLPLSSDEADRLGLDLADVLEQAQTPADAMQQAMLAARTFPQLDGEMQGEIGKRMAYLQGFFQF